MHKDLSIDALNERGQGVSYTGNGNKYFVDGALPGESVEAEFLQRSQKYTRAKLTQIHKEHRGRVPPFCPVANSCGGCTLQHLAYSYHADFKEVVVRRAFGAEEIALPAFSVHLASQNQGWRIRTNLAVGATGLRELPGLYAMNSQNIVGVPACPVDHPDLNGLRERLLQLPELQQLPGWSAENQTGLRHLLLRTNSSGGAMYVGFVGRAVKNELVEAALQACMALPRIVGCTWLEQTRDTNSLFRTTQTAEMGTNQVQEQILGHTFSMPALGFVQQHRQQTEALYRAVLDTISQKTTAVTELFAGSGILACLLASNGHTVDAWENSPDALLCFARNLSAFEADDRVAIHQTNLYQNDITVNTAGRVVIADPPRKGLGNPLLHQLTAEPASELHYISCNPASAARDVNRLQEAGYKMTGFSAWDLFPWTTHVELYICLKT